MTKSIAEPRLSIGESAEILNCCHTTVRREIARKRLPAQKVGSRWRIDPQDLRAYLSRSDDELHEAAVRAAPPPTPELLERLAALFD